MEKKLYFAPESEVILIKTSGMLAGSPIGDDGGEVPISGPVDPGNTGLPTDD